MSAEAVKTAGAKIVVDGIGKAFQTDRGELQVLDTISLDVGDGETVAIVGPSGCGKSTLMGIIAGFQQPDRGRVLIDGAPLTAPSPRGILISQQGSVFPWLTVQENLMFGLTGHALPEKQALADHYASMVGLKGFERSFP